MKLTHFFQPEPINCPFLVSMREDADSMNIRFTFWERVKMLFVGELWIERVKIVKDIDYSLPKLKTYPGYEEYYFSRSRL